MYVISQTSNNNQCNELLQLSICLCKNKQYTVYIIYIFIFIHTISQTSHDNHCNELLQLSIHLCKNEQCSSISQQISFAWIRMNLISYLLHAKLISIHTRYKRSIKLWHCLFDHENNLVLFAFYSINKYLVHEFCRSLIPLVDASKLSIARSLLQARSAS